jgi:alpha-glucosidase
LLPLFYTTLEEAHRTGVPLFRPLLLNYQDDANTLNIDDEFMIGDDLLAAPVLEPGATRRLVYLPKGIWFDYWTRAQYKGGQTFPVDAPIDTLPLFVRGGAILPLGPEMSWVGEKPFAPITFEIYPDQRGQAEASLYEDDGLSPAYRQGAYRRLSVHATKSGNGYTVYVDAAQGAYRPPARNLEFNVASRATNRNARQRDDGAAHRILIR